MPFLKSLSDAFSTHLPSEERVKQMKELAEQSPAKKALSAQRSFTKKQATRREFAEEKKIEKAKYFPQKNASIMQKIVVFIFIIAGMILPLEGCGHSTIIKRHEVAGYSGYTIHTHHQVV